MDRLLAGEHQRRADSVSQTAHTLGRRNNPHTYTQKKRWLQPTKRHHPEWSGWVSSAMNMYMGHVHVCLLPGRVKGTTVRGTKGSGSLTDMCCATPVGALGSLSVS